MLNTPRVLFLDQAGEIGGAQMSLLDLVVQGGDRCHVMLFKPGPFEGLLIKHGSSVTVADGGEAFVSVPRGASVFGMLTGVSSVWKLGAQASKLARNYDVIYANTQKALFVGSIAAKIAQKPLVWHIRDLLNAPEVSMGARVAALLATNHTANLVITNSKATEAAYRAVGGKVRSEMIYNGIDVSRFNYTGLLKEDIRAKFSASGTLLGVFSRLAQWKGQHVAIKALTKLPNTNLLLVGGALFGESDYETRLHRLVTDLNLQGRVHFLGARADVPELMQLCDVVLHTSVSAEPFGRVVVEGMLSGNPVIATAAGGVLEIIEDGISGVLVKPDDPVALATAVSTLLENPALMASLATAGRSRAMANFSVESYQKNVFAAIESVAGQKLKI